MLEFLLSMMTLRPQSAMRYTVSRAVRVGAALPSVHNIVCVVCA